MVNLLEAAGTLEDYRYAGGATAVAFLADKHTPNIAILEACVTRVNKRDFNQTDYQLVAKRKRKGVKVRMKEFRQDFPDLPERDYRIASCFFAGFDAPLIMDIFRFNTSMAVHSKKRRLKTKIISSSSCHKEKFLKLLK